MVIIVKNSAIYIPNLSMTGTRYLFWDKAARTSAITSFLCWYFYRITSINVMYPCKYMKYGILFCKYCFSMSISKVIFSSTSLGKPKHSMRHTCLWKTNMKNRYGKQDTSFKYINMNCFESEESHLTLGNILLSVMEVTDMVTSTLFLWWVQNCLQKCLLTV